MKSLRPTRFRDFVGQKKVKETLKVLITSAQRRKTQLDHVLIYGEPGYGKTTLANIIAHEVGANIRYAQGPLIEKKADILSLFASIKKHDIIFVDEIHGINKNVEELIYSIMEDRVIDISIGPEGDSKIVRMKLPPFTLVGATTKQHKITKPLRDRFGFLAKLSEYSHNDMCKIVKNSAKKINVNIDDDVVDLVAKYSHNVPRIANNLLNRIYDFSIAKSKETVTLQFAKKSLESLGYYKDGLNDMHISMLKVLLDVLDEKSASLETVASLLRENKEIVENDVEPVLIRKGYITISSRGRRITPKGVSYITTYNLI